MIYLDSSAITKLAIEEAESPPLKTFLSERPEIRQVTSDLSLVEVPRAVVKTQPLALALAYEALRGVDMVPIDGSVLMSAASLPPITLRSLDTIHLASALAVLKHLTAFVTYDQRLFDAAKFHNLPAEMPA
ncbi:MAG: type II toxin-antitoxin system VapC family toxin [Micromonosporaceae bacterium]